MINGHHKLKTIAAACFLILAFIGATSEAAHGQTNQEKAARADQIFAEGRKLAITGATESQQASIPKFEQARGLYHAIDSKKAEANCFGWAAYVYSALGEKQQALK